MAKPFGYRILSALLLLAIVIPVFPALWPTQTLAAAEAAEVEPAAAPPEGAVVSDFTVPRPAERKVEPLPGATTIESWSSPLVAYSESERMANSPGDASVYSPPHAPLSYQPAEDYVFAALEGAGVARYDGITWTLVNAGLPTGTTVYELAVDPFTPTTLLAASDHGTYKTTNAVGQCQWSQVVVTPTRSVAAHPWRPDEIYAGIAAAVEPGSDQVLYMSSSGEGWFGGDVIRSTNGGLSWTYVRDWRTGNYPDVAVSPYDYKVWTGGLTDKTNGTTRVLLWSADQGSSWTTIPILEAQPRCVAFGAPGTIWAGGNSGYTWASTDGGAAWSTLRVPQKPGGGYPRVNDITPLSRYYSALVSPTISLVEVAPDQVTADGVATATITVTVLQAQGQSVPSVTVILVDDGGGTTLTQPLARTNADGQSWGAIRGIRGEVVHVRAWAAGAELSSQALVTFIGPDLAVAKAGPAVAAPGETLTYTLALANAGRLPATGVVVTDTLPAEIEFVTHSASFTFSRAGTVLTWQVGALTISQQTSWTVQVRLSAETPAGALLTNTVTAAAPATEHDLDNNTATATTLVRGALHVDPAQPDIVVGAGESVNLVLTARNTGATDLHGLYVSLPVSLSWVTPAGLSSSLPAHSTDTFTLTIAPPTSTLPGYYQGRVTVHTNEGEETAVALTALVWNGPRGAVAFSVTTELSGTALPGAEVTLLYLGGASSHTLILQNLTGATGTLTMAGVPAGDYNYRVTAPGYAERWGQMSVPEGGVASVPVQLWSDFVNYEWWVEETNIPDEYDVLLTITYRLTDRPILVPCGPWHEFPMVGEAPDHAGDIEIHNPSGVDAFSVTVSASDVHGLAMNIAGNGWLGNVAGESGTTIHYTATAGESLDSNYEAGRLLLSGTYFSGSERLPFTQSIPLLVNPTPTMTCQCTTDPEYYRTHCERPGVPGGPGGPPPPPYNGGWDPIVPGPYQQARLRLSQTATLSRQAFWVNLAMNSRNGYYLRDVHVVLSVVNEQGQDARDQFFMDASQAQWDYVDISKPWKWLLIPKACTGGQNGADYLVSAQVTFVVDRTPPLTLTFSTGQARFSVRPAPRMFLYYYLPRDIEQDVPFRVQIVAQNWGYGPAADVRLGVPQVRALDGGGGGLELQVIGSDLDLGNIAPFQEAVGYVDLRPTASGYVESVAAGLTHRDYQGLRLDPLLLRQQTYLVYCDHVALAAEATLPDPGPECAPPDPPPAPHLVWVRGWADEVAAVPGETVTHTYTVYNLNLAEAVSISLAAASEHSWPVTVTGIINAPPGQGIVVPVRLAVPADAPYGPDSETLQAAYVPDPRITHQDSTTTRVVPIRILRIEVAPATVLQRNTEGWYSPDPLTYTVVLRSGVAGNLGRLAFHLNGSERLRAIPLAYQPPLKTGPGWFCDASGCSETLLDWPIAVGENRIAWNIWVQPMITTTLRGYAWLLWENYPEEKADAPDVYVPLAQIHPVVVLPGILGTFPPAKLLFFEPQLDPIEHTYDPLLQYLQRLGYESDISLFGYPYDWRKSVTVTADLLQEKIDWIKDLQRPGARPDYVDFSKVDLVAHSMGGLVARAYLEREDHSADVNKLVTLATPHRGAPEDYLTWEGLELREWGLISYFEFWVLMSKYAYNEGFCPVPICTPDEFYHYVHARVLGVRDLLPTADVPPYLVDYQDIYRTYPVTVNDPLHLGWPDNPVLEDLNSPGGSYNLDRLNAAGLTIWALYSLNYAGSTILQIRVQDCYSQTCSWPTRTAGPSQPFWEHGMPYRGGPEVDGEYIMGANSSDPYDSGDGVVPGYSSAALDITGWTNVRTWTVNPRQGGVHETIPKECRFMLGTAIILIGVASPPDPQKWSLGCIWYE